MQVSVHTGGVIFINLPVPQMLRMPRGILEMSEDD